MGIDLTLAGHPPILCPAARVTGIPPIGASATAQQRTRWEHGHLNAIVTQFPRLLVKGLLDGNVTTLAVALEISVPPTSFLVGSWFILSLAALGLAGWLHQLAPAFVVAAGWVMLGAGVLLAWARFGHDLISFSTMLSIPFYVLRKLSSLSRLSSKATNIRGSHGPRRRTRLRDLVAHGRAVDRLSPVNQVAPAPPRFREFRFAGGGRPGRCRLVSNANPVQVRHLVALLLRLNLVPDLCARLLRSKLRYSWHRKRQSGD